VAGSELFLNYGEDWHEWRDGWETQCRDYDTLEDYNRHMDYSNLPTEKDKRAQLNPKMRHKNKNMDRDEGLVARTAARQLTKM
jgi:hypothetical protein